MLDKKLSFGFVVGCVLLTEMHYMHGTKGLNFKMVWWT